MFLFLLSLYTLSISNIRNTFLILSCPTFCPQNSLNLSGHESVPKGCWPMLTPMLPTVVSSWLDLLWVVDRSVACEKPSSVAVLDTNWCAWHVLPYPVQRHLNVLSRPFTFGMVYIPCLNCLKAETCFFNHSPPHHLL